MLQGIDLNSIRQYNTTLKSYKDKAANLNAQIEYANNELTKLCNELSMELGREVNATNVEQIYKEQVEKINSTLRSGNTVLTKIASEESAIQSGASAVSASAVQASAVTPNNMAGVAGVEGGTGTGAGVGVGSVSEQTPQMGQMQGPVFGTVFNGSDAGQMHLQQPLFKLG